MIRSVASQIKLCARRFATLTTEQKVRVNDVDINYLQTGSGNRNVLLLPGAIGSASVDFRPQIEKLPDILSNYNILAIDLPGYGKSRPPKRVFTTNFYHDDAEYAKAFMDTVGKSKFSILGWSDGGIVGMILSARYSESVEKLVMWGSNAYISEADAKIYADVRDVNKWSKRMREPLERIYGVEGFAEIWNNWTDAALGIYRERNGDICKKDLSKIKAQIMILHGKKDPMVAAEHISYLLKHLNGPQYYEFPEGKHNIHLKYSDEFNEKVAEFLNKM